ncbi:hypothetical protein BSLG_004712 [Batrachochytrium salamandrivorans]|nr:hypothetical protein BSLG_004712 [Batrachochytrium salamandrivorans]
MNTVAAGRDRILATQPQGTTGRAGALKEVSVVADFKTGRKADVIKFHANTNKINVAKDPAVYRADREMNLAHFKELMHIFRSSSNNDTGTMSLEDFKSAFATVLGKDLTTEQLSILFMKIDANTDNAIDWEDFSTYMLLYAEGKKLMLEEAETQLFDTDAPKHVVPTAHKDVIIRIQYIESQKRYMSCSREGTLCYWNDRLKLQRVYKNAGQPCDKQSGSLKMKVKKANTIPQHYRWIHDAVFMENVNKVALASDDHQITIYDGTTLEKVLGLDLQNINVLTLDYWADHETPNSIESMLLYGTDSGSINVFTFNNDKMFKVGVQKKDQAEHIFIEKEGCGNKALKNWGTLWKRHAHGDWAVKVKYVPDLRAIISCSPDPRESLVVAIMDLNRKWQVHISPVSKGVNSFAYCRFPVTLVTGGTDRQLRLWNPHRLHHPMAAMKGHNSPITDITVNELNGQVISLSVDKNIKIWDIRKQQCLQTLVDTDFHRPDDIISAVMFNPHSRKIVTGTYALKIYNLKEQTAITENPKSHDFPIRSVMYNSTFKQVVSGCDGGVVNVWDALSGQKTFRFSNAHGKSEITAMAFDTSGRRLATGGRDGTIKIWNFNNGQLLQDLVKKDKTEVTGLAFVDMRDSIYFVATGWNREITMFIDDPNSLTLYPKFVWPDPAFNGSNSRWHQDDILSMVFCLPNMLATSSYDGEIIICNLHSGHVLHRLSPVRKESDMRKLERKSIDKVLFLQERSGMREAASLVSVGADGYIRFWNIIYGTLLLEVDGAQERKEGIFTMATNTSNTLLFTGDALGWVCVYDIHEAALNKYSPMELPLLVSFHAHVRSVTSMDIIEALNVIVTSSADCTIRMHTMKGEYIGIFGQSALWELGNQHTYLHPLKPIDVMHMQLLETERDKANQELKEKTISCQDAQEGPVSTELKGTDHYKSTCIFGQQSRASSMLSIDSITSLPIASKHLQKDTWRKNLAGSGRVRSTTLATGTQNLNIDFDGISKKKISLSTTTIFENEPTFDHTSEFKKNAPPPQCVKPTPLKPALKNASTLAIAKESLGHPTLQKTDFLVTDFLERDTSLWYARSQYALDTFHKRGKKRSHFLKPINIIQGSGLRIYHNLQPYELEDINRTDIRLENASDMA